MCNDLTFRKASKDDYPLISKLLAAAKLPSDGAEEHIDNFIILLQDNEVIGAIGLEKYGSSGLLRSFVILDEHRNKGRGLLLYNQLITSAKKNGITKVFLLTETAEKFFTKQGFKKISRNDVDEAVKDSVEFKSACPQSAVCMLLKMN